MHPIIGLGQGFVASRASSAQTIGSGIISEKNWIQKAFNDVKKRGTEGVCTGSKFGSKSCPPGSKRYNMAKNLRKISKGK